MEGAAGPRPRLPHSAPQRSHRQREEEEGHRRYSCPSPEAALSTGDVSRAKERDLAK